MTTAHTGTGRISRMTMRPMALYESGDSNGSYALIEVKLGGSEIEDAACNLLALKSKIDTDRKQAPSFLMVLTVTEYGYRREGGVYVVSIGCIKY